MKRKNISREAKQHPESAGASASAAEKKIIHQSIHPEADFSEEEESEEEVPVFPEELYEELPEFLRRVVAPADSPEERDILLLGSLTTLSSGYPQLYGFYDGKKIYSNLYLFVTAPASAGKGRLNLCKNLVQPIHKMLREQANGLRLEYASELAAYHMNRNEGHEKPERPPERMLFIPANNSTTGVFQLLADNSGHGLVFETEGDTLTQSLRSDNFSDGFRKAFHHETISYFRRTDQEYVDIENPCLSIVLSGTPRQVSALIPDAENGLFSRFLFYYMNLKPVWKNVFTRNNSRGIDEYYLQLGEEFLKLHKTLNRHAPIEVQLSQAQEERFHEFFSRTQIKYLYLQPEEYIATVRRMGIICFRLAMLLSGLRMMEGGEISNIRQCEDRDYDSAMSMIKVLLKHSSKVFSCLLKETKGPKRSNRKERFLESLPRQFSRQDYLEKAADLTIVPKTAEFYMSSFIKNGLIHRDSHNSYLNPIKEGGQDIEDS